MHKMLGTLCILLLGCHFAFGSDSVQATLYHKGNDGADPQTHETMTCASFCSQDTNCNGFVVDDVQCELITSNTPDMECNSALSACYIKM